MTNSAMPLALILSALVFLPGANAQEISIEPGEWRYSVNGLLGLFPLTEDGTECVSPDEATADLQELVDGLGAECTLENAKRVGNNITASVACEGALPIEADVDITATSTKADIKVVGTMSTGGSTEFPVNLNATAERLGSCRG